MAAAYDETFFGGHTSQASTSAGAVAPVIQRLLGPRSVIDIGCALGEWAAAFWRLGCEVRGIDGDYVDRSALLIPSDRFTAADLGRRLTVHGAFDLAVCLEVAEHLPESRAATLVADLTKLAPAVLFSAAIPHQGGEGHVNEQWPEYWRDLFAEYGYAPIDCIRKAVWDNPAVRWWYAQNCFLYVREDCMSAELRAVDGGLPLRLIHPHLFGYWTSEWDALRRRSPWRELVSRAKRIVRRS